MEPGDLDEYSQVSRTNIGPTLTLLGIVQGHPS